MSHRLEPRPQQLTALADLARAFAIHDRAQLVMACGTGKTFVGRWHAQGTEAQRVVVFAPSLALLAQTIREWRRVGEWPFEALVVCSDPTTAAGAAERRSDDGAVADVDEPTWAKVRAVVTTSAETTAKFLAGKTPGRPQVVFSTYHSAPVVAAAQSDSGVAFDLEICDEAHRLAGRPREEFLVTLDPRGIVARKRLFMTATPQIVDGDDVISMGDPHLFGPVAHTVTFGEAIEAGLLTDYQVLIIAGRAGDGVDDEQAPDTVPAALLDAVDRHGIRRLLTFHNRVAKAAAFADLIDAARTPRGTFIRARYVSGKQSTGDRVDALRWLGADDPTQVRLVANSRCLSEGVDVPAVDAVMFADQRSSVVDIIQAAGRVVRPSPGKTRGTVIIPVTLPEDGDDDTNLATSAFRHVWAVLRGLRAHDQRLAEELDRSVHRPSGWYRVKSSHDKIQFILPDRFDTDQLYLRLVQEVGSGWERFYAAAEDWAFANPSRRIGRNTSHRGVGIGEWSFKQRMARTRGMLTADQINRLERIPNWYWDRQTAEWDDTYATLEAFAQAYGTVADNTTGETIFSGLYSSGEKKRRMGVWIAMQRQAYRAGVLDTDRIRLLEKLPGWTWDGGLPAQHLAMIEALRVFAEFERHANVPEDHQENGLPLGRWCWAIRRAKLLDQLPPALADEISAATPRGHKGAEVFKWEKAETQWRLMYAALRQYAEREGTPVPPVAHREEFAGVLLGLGQWVSLQRFKQRRGELEQRYVDWLEALTGWKWEVEGVKKEYGDPIDLGGWPHGTAKGIQAKCPCKDCLDARRTADRDRLAKARTIHDGVPAGNARRHLTKLVDGGAKLTVIASVSGVPLGVLRKVASGDWDMMQRHHSDMLLSTTAQMCMDAGGNRTGSRGRMVSADNEHIDSAPTWKLLDNLDRRGFGIAWVARELGYTSGMQIRRDVITRRLANKISDLHRKVGNLTYPRAGNERVPALAELLSKKAA